MPNLVTHPVSAPRLDAVGHRVSVTPEYLQDMTRRHHQEHLLFVAGFEPLLPDGAELFTRTGAEHPELYTRSRALVVGLRELTAVERGAVREEG